MNRCTTCGHDQHDHLLNSHGCVWTEGEELVCLCQRFEVAAPDQVLTDLLAAHTLRVVELNEAARYPECNGCDWVGGLVKGHAKHLAELLTAAYTITPKLVAKPGIPCGDWADGHSYRKCTRPKGHEGHHG